MCGIFGQITNNPRKINDAAIKILGLANESRGKDSCGIFVDGEIYYGVQEEKLFSNFIKGRNFKAKKFPIVFGHTRTASVGIVNKYNAHPFGYGENADGDYKMGIVHNGTIINYKELAEKYKIKLTEKVPSLVNENMTIDRDKGDSEVLGEIIFKTKNYKVLSEYNGRAALVWTDTDEPNVVYLWSGMSASWEGIEGAEEERPLHVWIESKNNFYVSSLAEGLHYIGAKGKEAFQIDYNTVYKVTDGDFKNAIKTRVSRKDNYITKSTWGRGYGDWGDDYYGNWGKSSGRSSVRNLPTTTPNTTVKDSLNIFNDVSVKNQNEYKGKIYTKKLRYYRNGNLIKGICLYISGYGLYPIGDDYGYCRDKFKSYVGVKFNDGDFDLFGKCKDDSLPIPFKDINAEPVFFYFVDGCMLKTRADYEAIIKMTRFFKKNEYYDHQALSHASMYPVIDIKATYKFSNEQGILHNGELYSGTINGLLFEKKYEVRGGNLVKVELIEELNKPTKTYEYNETIYQQVTDFLKENEYNIEFEESNSNSDNTYLNNIQKNSQTEEEINQIIDEIVNEEFAEPLDIFYNTKEKIEKYIPNPSAKEAVRIIDSVIMSLKEFTKNE